MTPAAFKFHVSVPRDARLAAVVRDLAVQAASYGKLSEAAGQDFAARVGSASEAAMAGEGSCAIDFECADGELRVTIGGDTVRQAVGA